METIYKYALEIEDEQIIKLPFDAKILSVKEQGNNLVLYAKVNRMETGCSDVTVYIFGTGHDIPNSLRATFIDTVMTNGGRLVWHVFIKNKTFNS